MPDIFGEDTLEELRWKIGQARTQSLSRDERIKQQTAADPDAFRLGGTRGPDVRPSQMTAAQSDVYDGDKSPYRFQRSHGIKPQLPPEEFDNPEDVYRAIGKAMIENREMGPIVVPKGVGR